MCTHKSSPRERTFRAWQIPGVEVHAAPEGSVLVLKGKLSVLLCFSGCQTTGHSPHAVGTSLSGVVLQHDPSLSLQQHTAVSALICPIPLHELQSISSCCKARCSAGLRQTSESTRTIATVQRTRNTFWQEWFVI